MDTWMNIWMWNSLFRNPLSTAGNSMTSSERPSPEPFLKKKCPQQYWGGDNSGNALEASNAFNYRVWGIPAVLSTGIPGNALRAFPGSFRNFSGISSGKSQPYWGCGPIMVVVLFSLSKKASTITIMNSTSRFSSRCPSRCAIHYGYRLGLSLVYLAGEELGA